MNEVLDTGLSSQWIHVDGSHAGQDALENHVGCLVAQVRPYAINGHADDVPDPQHGSRTRQAVGSFVCRMAAVNVRPPGRGVELAKAAAYDARYNGLVEGSEKIEGMIRSEDPLASSYRARVSRTVRILSLICLVHWFESQYHEKKSPSKRFRMPSERKSSPSSSFAQTCGAGPLHPRRWLQIAEARCQNGARP